MPLIPVNGIELNVEVEGKGLPIVMLHGFTGDMSTWNSLADILQERYTTVLVDLIGHGKSDAPEDWERYSMERCVEDLVALAGQLGIGEAVWMGYSMGGRVCLSLGVTARERCLALVLEGASGGIEDKVDRAARASGDGELAQRIEDEGVEWFADYWETQALFESQARLHEEARLRLRKQRLGSRASGLANSLRGMGTGSQRSVYRRLPDFDKPALFLAGEEDKKFVELGLRMSGLTPRGRFESISDAGHCAHLENPGEFNKLVADFLTTVEGETRVVSLPVDRGQSVA